MSANTYVAKRMWRWAREALAGLAGVAVSLVGASSVVANIGHEFIEQPESAASLVVSPVRNGALVAAPESHGMVQLADPKVVDGLHPGEAAYFGLALELRGASGNAQVSLFPQANVSLTGDLSYEVRSVADATDCASSWKSGQVLVSRRTITTPAQPGFLMTAGGPAVATCIRVVHDSDARDVETGSVQWRFVAAAA